MARKVANLKSLLTDAQRRGDVARTWPWRSNAFGEQGLAPKVVQHRLVASRSDDYDVYGHLFPPTRANECIARRGHIHATRGRFGRRQNVLTRLKMIGWAGGFEPPTTPWRCSTDSRRSRRWLDDTWPKVVHGSDGGWPDCQLCGRLLTVCRPSSASDLPIRPSLPDIFRSADRRAAVVDVSAAISQPVIL